MKISAIIPTKNRINFLKESLNSVFNQKRKPDEVIIVFDHDATFLKFHKELEIFLSSKFVKLRCVQNKFKRGVCGARNYGSHVASGNFLAFLDDDDLWHEDYLKIAEKYLSKGTDVFCASFSEINNDKIVPEKTAPPILRKEDFYTKNPGLRGSNLVIKKSLYKKIKGFDLFLPAMNDLDFGIRLSKIKNIKYNSTKQRLVYFRNHSGPRLSTPKSRNRTMGVRRFYQRYKNSMTQKQREKYKRHVYYLWQIIIK